MTGKDKILSESIPVPGHTYSMYQTQWNGESVNSRDGLARPQLDPWNELKLLLEQAWPTNNFADVTVLVGVSGGADSVCLLRLLQDLRPHSAKGRLVVGHYNHRLRGAQADADAAFVQDLANSLGIQFELGTSPTAKQIQSSSEESLRNQRYAFFETTAAKSGARYVALAHTSNDCIETILHHLLRGTGPAGLTGIPQFRDLGTDLVIARPLLNVSRDQIVAGLNHICQSHRHDQSNDGNQWNRNWIRNVLLPLIHRRYPEAESSILRAARLVEAQVSDLNELAENYFLSSFQLQKNGFRILSTAGVDPHHRSDRDCSGENLQVPQSLFVAAAVIAWERLDWPRGGIRHDHWKNLWNLAVGRTTNSLNLPGNVRASIDANGTVVVERSSGD